jgi:hypothetical protein
MTTQGSVSDFRYLLPRLFQGVTEEEYSYPCEMLFIKLDYAKWLTWPEDEVAAVRTYLRALWQEGLTSFPLEDRLPAFYEIETLLASVAVTGEALEPYLRTWTETKVKAADQHLIQMVTMFGADLSDGRPFLHAWWKDSRSQAEAIRNWLLQASTLQRIGDSAYLLRNDGFEHLFGPSFEALQGYGRAR